MSKKKTLPDGYVRYCPHCGHIGEVDPKHRDCCPDGSSARYVTREIAEHAKFVREEKITVSKVLVERALMYGDLLVSSGTDLLEALNKQGIGSSITRDLKRPQFEDLWRSIYPTVSKAWRDDLWVWVIDFEVVS